MLSKLQKKAIRLQSSHLIFYFEYKVFHFLWINEPPATIPVLTKFVLFPVYMYSCISKNEFALSSIHFISAKKYMHYQKSCIRLSWTRCLNKLTVLNSLPNETFEQFSGKFHYVCTCMAEGLFYHMTPQKNLKNMFCLGEHWRFL